MNGSKGVPALGLLACGLALSAFLWEPAPQKVKEGNRLYEEEKYTQALNRYHEAQMERPEAPEIPFNIGNSFYRLEKFREAREAHARSLQPGPGSLSAKGHYNIGNSLYREGNLQGALEAYKKAIDLDPSDIDTKYNIELIQKMLEEKETQKEERSQKQEEKPEEQQRQEGAEDQEKDQERGEDQGRQAEEKKGQKPEEKEFEISEEDAERLLNALQGEEKPLPTLPKKEGHRMPEVLEKDW